MQRPVEQLIRGLCASLVLLASSAAATAQSCVAQEGQLLDPQLSGDFLGSRCALSGDTCAIGRKNSVSIYVRSGGSWSLQSPSLAPPPLGIGQATDVDLDGDTLLVSDYRASGTGAVNVYVRSGSVWSLQATLTANDGLTGDGFGCSVAIQGDRAVVGAPFRGDVFYGAGAVYVFVRSGTTWTQEAKLLASPGSNDAWLGSDVDIDLDCIVAGGAGSSGNTCFFRRAGSSWSLETQFPVAAASVSIDGEVAVAHVPDTTCFFFGPLRVFERVGTSWTVTASLDAGRAGPVRVSGDRIVAGHPGGFCASYTNKVSRFERSSNGWHSVGELDSPIFQYFGDFGYSLDLEGTTLLVGAPGYNAAMGGEGTVFVFFAGRPTVGYCNAKTNSLGCVPAATTSGFASATAATGFTVRCTSAINQKPGLLFYGFSGRAQIPFQGAWLCVAPPVRRTVIVHSGGSPLPAQDCTGTFALDMNAFAAGSLGGSPDPTLRVTGTTVDAQWWGRDPGLPAPNNTQLSGGVEWIVCP